MVSDDLLYAREATHGEFADNAAISQSLKEVIGSAPNWHSLSNIQREALDLICTKIGRIMAGDAYLADHWIDLGGYSRLVVASLNNDPAPGGSSLREAAKLAA